MEVLFKILIECLKYLLTPYYTFVCMKYYQSRTESIWKRYFLFFQPNIFIRMSTFGFVYVFEGYNVSRVFFFVILKLGEETKISEETLPSYLP